MHGHDACTLSLVAYIKSERSATIRIAQNGARRVYRRDRRDDERNSKQFDEKTTTRSDGLSILKAAGKTAK